MDNYINRLVTFSSWPDNVTVSAIALSKAGFYYLGHGDEVECFLCKVRIKSWKSDDHPLVKHLDASPFCLFANEKSGNNTTKPKPQGHGHNSHHDNLYETENTRLPKCLPRQTTNIVVPDRDVPKTQNYFPSYAIIKPQELNERVIPHQTSQIDYTNENIRLASFTNKWPTNSPVLPQDIAAAGMYFTGPGDRVQCAWCRGSLYNWEPEDIPLNEHRKHFPKCPFIIAKLNEPIENKMQGLRLLDIEKQTVEAKAVAEKTKVYQQEAQTKQQNNWRKVPAVKIIRDMGFSDIVIEKAVNIILQNSSSLTTDLLMDTIFDLESQEDKEEASGYETLQTKQETSNTPVNSNSEFTSHNNSLRSLSDEIASEQKEISHLKEVNSQLKETTTCKICLDNPVGVLFLPCRHLVCCEDCGDSVAQCPVCRTVIVGTVKTFLG